MCNQPHHLAFFIFVFHGKQANAAFWLLVYDKFIRLDNTAYLAEISELISCSILFYIFFRVFLKIGYDL